MTKTLARIAAVLAVGLFTVDAGAAAGKARVGVLSLRGAGEGPVRAKISGALKANGFQVVGTEQLESSASGLGVSLDSDNGLRAVAKELNVSAFISGELSKKKAALTVRNGADGSVLGEDSFAGPNPKKIAAVVGSTFWRQLGPAVRQGKPPAGAKTKAVIAEEAPPPEEASEAAAAPPPPAEEKRAEKPAEKPRKKAAKKAAEPPPEAAVAAAPEGESTIPPPKAEAAEESPSEGPVLPALTLGVGARGLNRSLSWHQDINNALAPYSLPSGPEAAVWVEAYPAAFSGAGIASRIGVFGTFNQGFGVTSNATGGGTLATKFQDYLVGAKLRWPVNRFTPDLSISYGAQTFKLEPQGGAMMVVPSVAYKFLRFGLGSRVDFTPQISADLGVAYLLLTDSGSQAGEIKSAAFFPGTTGYAIDAGASVAYRFMKILGVRAGVDFRQYGLSFNVPVPPPTGALVVGGATDRYITFWGGIELLLDGAGGATSDDDEKEPAAPASKAKTSNKAAPAGEESGGEQESGDKGN